MSGSGGGAGYEYQADAFAFVSTHALSDISLNWFERTDDIVVAISLETGSAGDDLLLEIRHRSPIEVQAKYHARFDQDFRNAFTRLFRGIASDPDRRGVLLVDSGSSRTIRVDLRNDFARLGQQRVDHISKTGKEALSLLKSAGFTIDADYFARLKIVVLDLDAGSSGEAVGHGALRNVLADPVHVRDAWQRLGKLGLRGTAQRGRSDVAELVTFLEPTIAIRRDSQSSAAIVLRYRDWLRETLRSFRIIGFPSIRLDAEFAWDEMVESGTDAPATLEDELNRYYGKKPASGRPTEDLRAEDVVLMAEDCVIVGAAGAGKTTLVRKLVMLALEEDRFPLRVPLKSVASRLTNGASIDEAITAAGLEGSGITDASLSAISPSILIADGLDECAGFREVIADYLRTWRAGHPHCNLVVTSRLIGHSLADFPTAVHAELEPLHWRGIHETILAIFTAYYGDAAVAATKAAEFVIALEANQTAAVAARTPLLLASLAALFTQGRPLPSGRVQLYRDIIELLRDQPTDRTAVHVHATIADRVLEIVGWLSVEEPLIPSGTTLAKIGQQLFRDHLASSELAGAALAEQALGFWEERRVIERLTIATHQIYTFVHLSLAESAASRFAVRLNPQELDGWLMGSYRKTRWRETILLSAPLGTGNSAIDTLLAMRDDSDAILLAADVAIEAHNDAGERIGRIVAHLTDLLSSSTHSVASEAAQRLITIVTVLPTASSRGFLPLLNNAIPIVRLAAEGVVMSGGPSDIPSGFPERWLEAYLPIVRFRLGKAPLPPHNTELPTEAHDLHARVAGIALDALFRTTHAETALNIATRFLGRARNFDVLQNAENVMYRFGYGAEFRESTSWLNNWANISLRSLDTPRHRAEIRSLLDAIAAVIGQPPAATKSNRRWRYLARLLSVLDFWRSDGDMNVETESDRELLRFALERAILAGGVDRDRLREDLGLAMAFGHELTLHHVFERARHVRLKTNWRRAAWPPDPSRVRAMLRSNSPLLQWTGAVLLEHGAGADETCDILRDGMLNGGRSVLFWLTQIAPDIVAIDIATSLVVDRLSMNPNRAVLGILEALELEHAYLLPGSNPPLLSHITDLTKSDDEIIRHSAQRLLRQDSKGSG